MADNIVAAEVGSGKTFNFSKEIANQCKQGQLFLITSKNYSVLSTWHRYLLEHGLDESCIAFIPQPKNSPSDDTYQFHCPRYEELKKSWASGFDSEKTVCHSCDQYRDHSCPKYVTIRKANRSQVILMTSQYLRSKRSIEWMRQRHIILDEEQNAELLRVIQIKRSSVEQFKDSLERFVQRDARFRALYDYLHSVCNRMLKVLPQQTSKFNAEVMSAHELGLNESILGRPNLNQQTFAL